MILENIERRRRSVTSGLDILPGVTGKVSRARYRFLYDLGYDGVGAVGDAREEGDRRWAGRRWMEERDCGDLMAR